jgi:hypothetical protein
VKDRIPHGIVRGVGRSCGFWRKGGAITEFLSLCAAMEAKLSKPNASNRFLCAAVYDLLQAFMWVAPIFCQQTRPCSSV